MTNNTKTCYSSRLLTTSLSILLSLIAIHLVLQFVSVVLFDEKHLIFFELSNRFDFADEMSIPTWFSQALFLVASSLAFLLAYLERSKAARKIWKVLAIVMLLGSVDEVAAIHESILQVIHISLFEDNPPTLLANAWVIIIPIILVFALAVLYKMYANLPRQVVRVLIAAFSVYFIGAVIVELISSISTERSFFEQGILAAVEESLEVLGLIMVVFALARYIETRHSDKIGHMLEGLKR